MAKIEFAKKSFKAISVHYKCVNLQYWLNYEL